MGEFQESIKEAKYHQRSFLLLLLGCIGLAKRYLYKVKTTELIKRMHVAADHTANGIQVSFEIAWENENEQERDMCYEAFCEFLQKKLKTGLKNVDCGKKKTK